MLQRHNIDAGFKTSAWKRQRGQIRDGVQLAVIPPRIAHRKIHSNVALAPKIPGVHPFSSARVQYARPTGQTGRKLLQRIVDRGLEVQHMTPQKPRQATLDGPIRQVFLRASSMMVEPAPHAASNNVNGSAANRMPK